MRTYLGALRQLFRGKGLSREIFGFSKSSLFSGNHPRQGGFFYAKFALRNTHCEIRIAQSVHGSLPPTQRCIFQWHAVKRKEKKAKVKKEKADKRLKEKEKRGWSDGKKTDTKETANPEKKQKRKKKQKERENKK